MKTLRIMLKLLFRSLQGTRDITIALLCLSMMGFGFYWLLIQPLDEPFGLAILTYSQELRDADQSELAEENEEAAPPKKISSSPSGISDNDIMAADRDENQGRIKDLTPNVKDYILNDKGHRISDHFVVSDDLRKRVEFWFKIYSLYNISHAVIHDNAHPWIIYEIVNLNSVYNLHRTRDKQQAAKSDIIRRARYKYINILKKLAERKTYFGLSSEEKAIYDLFKNISGPKQKVFQRAKNMVRVQRGQKDSVIYAIKRSGRYLKTMEKVFAEADLPSELTRIPFLESSFNMEAYSKDGASGVWQFMAKTGKAFLRVTHAEGIDERNDPVKATRAATRLLKQNYKILGSWPLAVTAYNHGPGGLLRGIKKLNSRNLNDLIENYHHNYFGFASKNFYSEFLAMLHVEKYQDMIFGEMKKDQHLVYDSIEVEYAMRVKFIMDLCQISQEDIRLYNPDLRSKILDSKTYLPEGYYLNLPKGKTKPILEFYQEVEETNKMLDDMLGEDKG